MTATAYPLPPLPYPADALSGISRTTLEIHHGRHHRAYVDRLNALAATSPLNGRPLEELVRKADGALFNNAAQAWNHAFYWNCLTPERGLAPGGRLAQALARDFGSVDAFIEKFRMTAIAHFGSGWTWLAALGDGRLAIESTDTADTPLRHGHAPLLTCDLWEHAYYLDYRNERARYVDTFLQRTHWTFVAENLAAAVRAGPSREGHAEAAAALAAD